MNEGRLFRKYFFNYLDISYKNTIFTPKFLLKIQKQKANYISIKT